MKTLSNFFSAPIVNTIPNQREPNKEYTCFCFRHNSQEEKDKWGAARSETHDYGFHAGKFDTDKPAVVYFDKDGKILGIKEYEGAYPYHLLQKRWARYIQEKEKSQ